MAKPASWNSRGLNGETLAARFPVLHKHSRRKNRMVAEAITNNRWITDIDHNPSQEIVVEYINLWEELENIVRLTTRYHLLGPDSGRHVLHQVCLRYALSRKDAVCDSSSNMENKSATKV
jgi:hypothetical protein